MPRLSRLRERTPPPVALLGVLLAAAVAALLWETRGQSLLFDEWTFFADYRGHSPDVLLNPFSGNVETVPLLIYKAVFATFGPGSIALRLLMVVLNLTAAVLLFGLVRRRVGEWIALAATAIVIFLGAASDIVAATIGIAIMTSVACGLGTLVALEREDSLGDRLACALLTASVFSNSVGLAFLAGAAVDVGSASGFRPRRRWALAAVPLVLYAAARLYAAHLEPLGPLAAHPLGITLTNIGALPSSIATSLGDAAVSLSGLFTTPGLPHSPPDYAWTPSLAVLLGALAILRLRRGPAPTRRLLVFAVMPLVYWGLIALVVSDRLPGISRYQYAGAIFLILLAAELAAGLRIGVWTRAAVVAGFGLALGPNLLRLHDGSNFLRVIGQQNKAELAAVEIAGDQIGDRVLIEPLGARLQPGAPLGFAATEHPIVPTTDVVISAQHYLDAVRVYGSPAFSAGELAAARPYLREAADQELFEVLGITLAPAARRPVSAPRPMLEAGEARPENGCLVARPAPGTRTDVDVAVPVGGLTIDASAGRTVPVTLRRFADDFTVAAGTVVAGMTSQLRIPPDASPAPWRARLSLVGETRICGVEP